MKRYLTAVFTFLMALGLATATHKVLEGHLDEKINSIVLRLILLASAILLMSYFHKGVRWFSFPIKSITQSDYLLMALVVMLFGMNNILSPKFGQAFDYRTFWGLTLIKLTLGSISEEFLYRGYIQTYINAQKERKKTRLSSGNLFATVLMTMTHLGFFTIMTPIFAMTSLLLVFIFSLTAGHLRDKTGGLTLPIILHLAVNYVHFLIQVQY